MLKTYIRWTLINSTENTPLLYWTPKTKGKLSIKRILGQDEYNYKIHTVLTNI